MVNIFLGALVLVQFSILASTQSMLPPPGSEDYISYEGYDIKRTGDQNSVVYETADTPAQNTTVLYPEPDVYLNASVHVGEILLQVDNITAKVNLDAQVLKLLHFNAGVNAHIDKVVLKIEKVEAKVILEARLGNLVLMINDVLHSLDLNPIIATLGQDLGKIVNTTVGGLAPILGGGKGAKGAKGGGVGGGSGGNKLDARSLKLQDNILYSVNDYEGRTHTNRVLAQDGKIVDQLLDNNGVHYGENVVGSYDTDMIFNGHNITMGWKDETVRELEYVYQPFPGLSVVSAIYVNPEGKVVGTQVISEAFGGGSSTVE